MMKKEQLKKRIALFVFAYFAIFSSYYTTDTLTKCVGSFSKNGNLSVAQWDVSVNSNSTTNFDVITGNTSENLENQTYTFSITSNSEVGITYSITLSNVPSGVQVIFDNNTYNESNNIVTINNAGSFNASDINSTHNHSFTFIAPAGTTAVMNNEVTIDVDFIQKALS